MYVTELLRLYKAGLLPANMSTDFVTNVRQRVATYKCHIEQLTKPLTDHQTALLSDLLDLDEYLANAQPSVPRDPIADHF